MSARVTLALLCLGLLALPAETRAKGNGWKRGAAGFDNGLREVDQVGTPMAALFVIRGCPACVALESRVLSTKTVQQAMKSVNRVRVDATRGGTRERALAERYGIRAFPTMLFFARGPERDTPLRLRGVSKPEVYLQALAGVNGDSDDDGEEEVAAGSAKNIYGHSTAEMARGDLEWAKGMLESGNTAEAIPLLRRAISRDPALLEASFVLAEALSKDGKAKKAVRLLTKLGERPRKDHVGEIYFHRSKAHAAAGDKARVTDDLKLACRAGYQAACTKN
jgi:thioredoxin-like negative regulator of GroEL